MKIPRNITISANTSVATEPSLSDSPPQTWISTAEASALLKVRPSTVINRIKKGTLIGKESEDIPFTIDGKENYVVLLEALPQKAQYTYLVSHLKEDEYVSVDLVSPRSTFGDVWISQFINIAQLIRDTEMIRQKYYGSGKVTKELQRLALSYGISLATLYRFTGQAPAKTVSLLYTDPVYLQHRLPKTMCLWSCDFTYALHLDKDCHYSQNDILEELDARRDKILCLDCPYHPDAPREGFDSDIPVCGKSDEYMVIPNNRRTLNRLLSHIPPELILYCRKGYREWRAKYGIFSMREKPLLVGENIQGDHHVFDIFVRVKIHKTKNEKTYEKAIAVRPVLTAWMDTATGYVVGWVISVIPNSDTIAEAFCRACVPTIGDIAMGLPKSITVDCGKDYKSKLLEDPCSSYTTDNWNDSFLNRRFSGMGVLRALGCDIYHSLPYHPQSKSIERMFGTIERDSISKQPGWCRNSVQERPPDFAKQLDRMLQDGDLLWLDEFAQKFAAEFLPAYHGKPDDPTNHPDLPGWLLAYESMSPAQRYASMEKARNVIPDWKTMSILKQHYYPEKTKVGPYGIRFQNVYYKADELSAIRDKYVNILCHSFTPPYAPASITVIYNNKAICEAFPSRKNRFTEEAAAVLAAESDIQNQPAREIKKAVLRISRSANTILPDNKTDLFPSQKDQLRDETYGPTPVEESGAFDSTSAVLNTALKDGSALEANNTRDESHDQAYDLLFGSI